MTDAQLVSLVFSSQGLPYSLGRAALDALETTYVLLFVSADEKRQFVEQVRPLWAPCCSGGWRLCW